MGRLIKFTPRRPAGAPAVVPDLPAYAPDEQSQAGEPDDYRHRMKMNLAAFAVVTLLVACGLWLANEMAKFRAAQDCMSMNLRGACAAIPVPDRRP